MEGVQHPGGVRQGGPQRGGVAAERVQRGHRDAVPPALAAAEIQSDKAFPLLPSTTSSSRARPFSATMPVTNTVPAVGVAARNAVSSTPSVCTPSSRSGSSTSGLAVLADRGHHRRPADPELGRHRGHRLPSLTDPAARLGPGPLGQRRPRPDRRRGLRPGPPEQRGSTHRHTRLTHTNVTGRPAAGRSRTQVGRRSCSRACTPQPGHQPSSAVVSTACSSSPSYSDTASTTNPATRASPSPRYRHPAPGTSSIDGFRHHDREVPGLLHGPGSHYGVARSPRLIEKSPLDSRISGGGAASTLVIRLGRCVGNLLPRCPLIRDE